MLSFLILVDTEHAILHANGRKMKNHRKSVDAVAASLMLEGYLGRRI